MVYKKDVKKYCGENSTPLYQIVSQHQTNFAFDFSTWLCASMKGK